MCAINPTHKKRIIFDVYTSEYGISDGEFRDRVLHAALQAEIALNASGHLRWHVKETTQSAD